MQCGQVAADAVDNLPPSSKDQRFSQERGFDHRGKARFLPRRDAQYTSAGHGLPPLRRAEREPRRVVLVVRSLARRRGGCRPNDDAEVRASDREARQRPSRGVKRPAEAMPQLHDAERGHLQILRSLRNAPCRHQCAAGNAGSLGGEGRAAGCAPCGRAFVQASSGESACRACSCLGRTQAFSASRCHPAADRATPGPAASAQAGPRRHACTTFHRGQAVPSGAGPRSRLRHRARRQPLR